MKSRPGLQSVVISNPHRNFWKKNYSSSLSRLPSASSKSMPSPSPQCLHCLHFIIVVTSPLLSPSNVIQSPPSLCRRPRDLHAAMSMKTTSSSLLRSSPPFPFIFMSSKKLFVISILPCYLPLYSSEMNIFKSERMMKIGWGLRFTSIYLDLEFIFEFRFEEDLIWFGNWHDLDKFC